MQIQHFTRCLIIVAALSSALAAAADIRILFVGDSWAAGMLGFQAFETAIETAAEEAGEQALGEVAVAGETTAIGGSRADQWAENHDGKLDTLRDALEAPVDLVVLSLGGNDLLEAALAGRIETAEQREELLERITRDMGILLDAIHDAAPEVQTVIIGYDYLAPKRIHETYGLEFPDSSIEHLDLALEELEDARHALATERDRVHFVRNLGLLRATYGPDAAVGHMPDGVHPTPEAYQLIAARAWEMVSWLLEEELAE